MNKRPKSFWILVSLTIFVSWLAWVAIFRAFFWDGSHSWFLSIGLVALMFSAWGLFLITEKSQKINRLVLLLSILPSVFMFGDNYILAILGFLFFFLLSSTAVGIIQRELKERIKLRVLRVLRFGLQLLVLAFAILFSLGTFSLLSNKKISHLSTPKFNINESSTFFILDSVERFSRDPEMKADLVFLRENPTLIEFVVESNFFEKDSLLIKTDSRYQEIFLSNLSKQLKVEKLSGNELVLELFVQIINKKTNEFFGFLGTESNSLVASVIGAITIFFIITSFGWLLSLPIRGLTYLWLNLFVEINLIEIEKVEQLTERVNLVE